MNLTKNLWKLRTLLKTLEKCLHLYLNCKYFFCRGNFTCKVHTFKHRYTFVKISEMGFYLLPTGKLTKKTNKKKLKSFPDSYV